MMIKKAIQSIEENNNHHVMIVYLCNEILEKYEKLNLVNGKNYSREPAILQFD
jgi:hypothetical protein